MSTSLSTEAYANQEGGSLYDTLAYRCQFILGPTVVEHFPSWRRVSLGSRINVTFHPDLGCYQVTRGEKLLTLLGFILDSEHPEKSDQEIVNGLVAKLERGHEFFGETDRLGGRWILIVDDGEKTELFNDALGLRQVFYAQDPSTQAIWCASQPEVLGRLLSFEIDQAASDFIDAYEFRRNDEYWWPGVSSPYAEVKHLLPNHCLDLKTGRVKRYWPRGELPELSLMQARQDIAGMLKGFMQGAVNRFDLALSITAGWDSRLVLAASRQVSDRITCLTVRQIKMPDNNADLEIPARLLSKLGLRHEIVRATYRVDPHFARVYRESVPFAHDLWAPDAQAILKHYKLRKAVIVGSGAEVARCFYRPLSATKVTGESLSHMVRMGAHLFPIEHFSAWLAGIQNLYNLNILDLFYWEQRAGNWLAMCQLEFGMVWKDIFTPYNCRGLLVNMLSVDERYRRKPEFKLHRELILALWPEVLSEPINPHKKEERRGMLRRLLHNSPPQLRRAVQKTYFLRTRFRR